MGRVGFEPTQHNAADLQSAPFNHSGTDPYSFTIYNIIIRTKKQDQNLRNIFLNSNLDLNFQFLYNEVTALLILRYQWVINSAVECLPYKQKVTGSNPVLPKFRAYRLTDQDRNLLSFQCRFDSYWAYRRASKYSLVVDLCAFNLKVI